MPERHSCYCTSTDIPVVCNIYVILSREKSVFKSDFKKIKKTQNISELSLTLITGFNKDWIFINNRNKHILNVIQSLVRIMVVWKTSIYISDW